MALVVKNVPTNAGDVRDVGSIARSRRFPREGHGNPLHYSCLENPMDSGAWQATVHGAPKSWTQLKWQHACRVKKIFLQNWEGRRTGRRKSTLNTHQWDWCWSWRSHTSGSWLIGKDPDAGKDWGQKEKRVREDEMVGWHHLFNGHELSQTPGDGGGQGSLLHCSPRACEESDMTWRLNNR